MHPLLGNTGQSEPYLVEPTMSAQEYLNEEIDHLRKSFVTINGFPMRFVDQVIEDYNHNYIRLVTEPPVENLV